MNYFNVFFLSCFAIYAIGSIINRFIRLKEFPPERVAEVCELLRNNRKSEAFRLVAKITYWYSNEVRNYVDALEKEVRNQQS